MTSQEQEMPTWKPAKNEHPRMLKQGALDGKVDIYHSWIHCDKFPSKCLLDVPSSAYVKNHACFLVSMYIY